MQLFIVHNPNSGKFWAFTKHEDALSYKRRQPTGRSKTQQYLDRLLRRKPSKIQPSVLVGVSVDCVVDELK